MSWGVAALIQRLQRVGRRNCSLIQVTVALQPQAPLLTLSFTDGIGDNGAASEAIVRGATTHRGS